MTPLRSTTLTRHSLRASRALTRSIAQRDPNTGQPQPYTARRRLNALLMAMLYTASPAVTICTHRRGAGARLTHLTHARMTLVAAAITAGAAATLMWTFSDNTLLGVIASLVTVLSGTLIALNVEAVWSAHKIPLSGTHLLTDVTRYPNAPKGVGGELVEDLHHHPATIIGTATNNEVWAKVYAQRTEPAGNTSLNRIHFRLRKPES